MDGFNVHTIVERSRWYPLNFSGTKACSRDRDASKQKARNVPLASADVREGGWLCDEPKECLRRRLTEERSKRRLLLPVFFTINFF